MTLDIKKQIAQKIGLSKLGKAGTTIVRNEEGIRVNEREIEYHWILTFNHLNGFDRYHLFTIKFRQSSFRDIENPQEIITGIYTLENDTIDEFYFESDNLNFDDQIVAKFNQLDLFYSQDTSENEVPSITDFLLETKNVSATISCEYIKNRKWIEWNDEIIKLSKSLSQRSKNEKLQKIVLV